MFFWCLFFGCLIVKLFLNPWPVSLQALKRILFRSVGTQIEELVNNIGGDTNHGNGKIHTFGGSLMIFYLERNPCVKQ